MPLISNISRVTFYTAIFSATVLASLASAEDFQIQTDAIEAPAKATRSKKALDPAKLAEPSKTAGERKTGGPDRQFGELEGWSPGKEPPKDPKDPSSKTSGTSGTGGAKISTTPSGNMGVGMGF